MANISEHTINTPVKQMVRRLKGINCPNIQFKASLFQFFNACPCQPADIWMNDFRPSIGRNGSPILLGLGTFKQHRSRRICLGP